MGSAASIFADSSNSRNVLGAKNPDGIAAEDGQERLVEVGLGPGGTVGRTVPQLGGIGGKPKEGGSLAFSHRMTIGGGGLHVLLEQIPFLM